MKEIAYGLQYKVYEYNKKQYLKKPTNFKFKLKVLNSWWPKMPLSKKKKFAIGSEKIMKDSIKFFEKNENKLDLSLIGNPIFLKKNNYLQDKVTTVRNYLKIHSYKQNCRIIERYIKLLEECIKIGFMEVVFNFTINCGVDKNKKVILFDFTEITTNLKDVLKIIKKKKWLNQYSYKKDLSPPLQKYFKKEMGKRLTQKKVIDAWNKK